MTRPWSGDRSPWRPSASWSGACSGHTARSPYLAFPDPQEPPALCPGLAQTLSALNTPDSHLELPSICKADQLFSSNPKLTLSQRISAVAFRLSHNDASFWCSGHGASLHTWICIRIRSVVTLPPPRPSFPRISSPCLNVFQLQVDKLNEGRIGTLLPLPFSAVLQMLNPRIRCKSNRDFGCKNQALHRQKIKV